MVSDAEEQFHKCLLGRDQVTCSGRPAAEQDDAPLRE